MRWLGLRYGYFYRLLMWSEDKDNFDYRWEIFFKFFK